MVRRPGILALLFSLVSSGAVVAIRDVTLIDGAGSAPQLHSTVIIQGAKISAAGPLHSTTIPKRAAIVDGRGKFLIPGLWDMHVHLWDKQNVLPLYVAHGITGVRDMGSDFARVSAWRSEIEAGRAIGPHILTSGPPVSGDDPKDEKLPVLVAPTPEDARLVFDRLLNMGVDFVKVLTSLPHDSYIALAERARHWNTDFSGHIPSTVTAAEAIEARQSSIEHMFGLFKACATDPARPIETFSEDRARELFARSALLETRHVPTLTLWQRMGYVDFAARAHDLRLRQVPSAIRATWPAMELELKRAREADVPQFRAQLALANRMVKLMQESGVEILAGTDTGDPWTIPGVSLHEELELLVKAYLTPAEALRTATVLPAKYLGWGRTVGLIKPGYAADLVLLDANPLADIRNVEKVAGVAIRGRYLNRAAILKIIAESERQ